MQKVSHPYSFIQSYRSLGEEPPPNDFPLYNESFSLAKMRIEGLSKILISNLVIQPQNSKNKRSAPNPVSLALLTCDENDIEYILTDEFEKYIDNETGSFDTYIAPDERFPDIPSRLTHNGLEFRVNYYDVAESDGYNNASAYKIIRALNHKIIYTISAQQGHLYIPETLEFDNTNRAEFLYMIPFVPQIQRAEVGVTGRINFDIDYLDTVDG